MITLNNIQFGYKGTNPLLEGINLTVEKGQCVLITGASGSGKTTLGRIINGLIPNFYDGQLKGEIIIDGVDMKELPFWQYSKKIGSVFQDPKSQFFTSIVQDELAFEMENYGVDASVIQQRLEHLMLTMDLAHLQREAVLNLSSGQKQKVAIGAAQMIEPSLFVMDEPSANLDLVATNMLKNELQKLKEQGKTLIIIEHRLHYLMDMVDQIIYMENGHLKKSYDTSELLALSADEIQRLGLRSPFLNSGSMLPCAAPINRKELTIEQLYVHHPKKREAIIKNLTLTLYSNEVTALVGKNGAGKTTLARVLAGLIKEKSGHIRIGQERLKVSKRLKKVWFVMQETIYQLFTDSVWNEMLLNHETQTKRAEFLLKELQLWHLKDRHPATLSGGEKQRLVLGIGLMNEAIMFILDEPTSGLDGENLQRIIHIIRKLAQRDCHLLIITHDHELIAGACQRMIQLEDGHIVADKQLHQLSYQEMVNFLYQMN